MKRRQALLSLAAAPCLPVGAEEKSSPEYENPYEGVDWETWECVHSMSHQHQGTNISSLESFREMGYGHFAFSNYYPSAPTPLLPAFREKNPDVVWAPNAEQHSFLDTGLHFNSLGSRLATGYGKYLSAAERKTSPIKYRFENLIPFDDKRPWEGVYRLDLTLIAAEGKPEAILTVHGATACNREENFADDGPIEKRTIPVGKKTFYVRASGDAIDITLGYNPEEISISQLRLMQGTNRPWREMFRAALDGEERDGKTVGGLLHPDGGGITLNHPTGKLEAYAEMLDFDTRVLGIEVWNQLTSGFGSDRGFYASMKNPPGHFYQLWDQILATGRRCWGFFVKDHNTYGRGRNVLLTPPLADLSPERREAALLRAYRNGAFFGSVASIATSESGETTAPYDHSNFRFRQIRLKRDEKGKAIAVEAAVGENNPDRTPNVQIRFITEEGITHVVDAEQGEWKLPPASPPQFIRVEACAYPDTHRNGKSLNAGTIRELAPAQIATLHDRQIERGPGFFGNSAELRTPLPIVDQIFSQPIRRLNA
ncbi:hypothetical protein OAK44_00185 [bacterium]|nr:hypothetical protein [Verrucomicrobiales bacterium]MDC0252217.1 hypothetical protein [bacterium]